MDTSELINHYEKGERTFHNIFLRGGITNLQGRSLPGINIRWSTFHEINLEEANLEKASLQEISFEAVNFQRVNLKKANLRELNLQHQNFEGANLQESILVHAQLQRANFKRANLQKADLTAANFRGADLRGANLGEANIRETNFEDVIYDETTIWKSAINVKKAILPAPVMSLILLQNESETDLVDYIEVNGTKTSLTFEEAKKQINKAINQRFAGRHGQSKFRKDLLKAYNGRCVVTGCDIEAALEAAHIVPYCLTKDNNLLNGLLLRADLHTLFDFNLIFIDPNTRVVYLAHPLQQSDSYRGLHRYSSIFPPTQRDYQPWLDALKWRHEKYQDFLDGK
jgi:uncharacterized protein YjbI with pentapeptide repeats